MSWPGPRPGEARAGPGVMRKRRDRGRKSCSTHGPLLVMALEEDIYVVKCLSCGLVGPERADALEAKLAFDQKVRTGV